MFAVTSGTSVRTPLAIFVSVSKYSRKLGSLRTQRIENQEYHSGEILEHHTGVGYRYRFLSHTNTESHKWDDLREVLGDNCTRLLQLYELDILF